MCMGAKASAVMCGEVKNSTQLDRFQLSWDPEQLHSQRGRRWRRRKESLNNNYAWSIMQRSVKRRCLTLSSVETMTRVLILCTTSSPMRKRAHEWILGQKSKKNSFWESTCKWAFHEDQLLIQHWRRGYPWGPGTHFLIEEQVLLVVFTSCTMETSCLIQGTQAWMVILGKRQSECMSDSFPQDYWAEAWLGEFWALLY